MFVYHFSYFFGLDSTRKFACLPLNKLFYFGWNNDRNFLPLGKHALWWYFDLISFHQWDELSLNAVLLLFSGAEPGLRWTKSFYRIYFEINWIDFSWDFFFLSNERSHWMLPFIKYVSINVWTRVWMPRRYVVDVHCKSYRFTDSQCESIDADYLFHSYCFQERNKYFFFYFYLKSIIWHIYSLLSAVCTPFPFFSIIFVIQEISSALYIILRTTDTLSHNRIYIGNHSIRVSSIAPIQTNLLTSHMKLLNYSWFMYFQHILP